MWIFGAPHASASVTILVGEPFGSFGTMMPVGHTAVYLDRACADGPLKLRMCRPGEPAGVVVARYHAIGKYDWLATPVMEFLYAVDRPEDALTYATRASVEELRERYRRSYLEDVVPDGRQKAGATVEWVETVGVAYDRRLWAYRMPTTEAQDEQFVAMMNARRNRFQYHLVGNNCANFAADAVNFFYPGAVTRVDRVADFGYLTPKQVARQMVAYGAAHPEANLEIMQVPQVPGTLRRSRPVRGSAEMLLKTKRYLATLLVIQPEVPLVLTVLYLDHGRWAVGKGATSVAGPETFWQCMAPDGAVIAGGPPPPSSETLGGAGAAPDSAAAQAR